MKTIIKTNIKDNTNFTVKESITEIYFDLSNKGSFIEVTRVAHNKKQSRMLLAKSTIKLVKQEGL
tara:strand:- start:258 stop:452 length:195 start_codon:yes stop_codon:yes gene_type:complete